MLSLHCKIYFPVCIKYAPTLKYNFRGTLWNEARKEYKCSWAAWHLEHTACWP